MNNDKDTNRIDAIYKDPRTGYFYDQDGNLLKIWQVFREESLYCFYGDECGLIVSEWNRHRACFFVIGLYERFTFNQHTYDYE